MLDYFTLEEIDVFKEWHLQPYNDKNRDHISAKNYLMNTIWKKAEFLSDGIAASVPDFKREGDRKWHKLGSKELNGKRVHCMQFKAYTWHKVLRKSDHKTPIFFTFGIEVADGKEGFVYKLDCQRVKGKAKLSDQQVKLFDSIVPQSAKRNTMPIHELLEHDYTSLIQVCANFIEDHIQYYDHAINAIGLGNPSTKNLKNVLVLTEKPQGKISPDASEIEERFNGVSVNFLKNAEEQKRIGDLGENLVKQLEVEALNRNGQIIKANQVQRQLDGKGFDILSFDSKGNEKYIEVKTTTKSINTPFYLTKRELQFIRLRKKNYHIYRIYQYDELNNCGLFYKLNGDVENQLDLQPTEYRVFLK